MKNRECKHCIYLDRDTTDKNDKGVCKFHNRPISEGILGCDNCKTPGRVPFTGKLNSGLSDLSLFKCISVEMQEIYKIKNKNYGNSFSEQFKEYGLTSVCIRLDDKIRRLKSLNKQIQDGNVNVDDEGVRDTLIDLANYAVLAIIELDKMEDKTNDELKNRG